MYVFGTNLLYRQHQDMRAAVKTRKERYRAIRLNWDAQMDTLVAAYLAWKHEAAAPTSPPEDPPPTPPAQPVLTTENQPVPADVIGQTNPTHRFDVVAIWTHGESIATKVLSFMTYDLCSS